ncbi:hypothetical protein [Siminovitchia fortis]|uniref:hypothetical protein n=1 Tax=Siminovitchia fortis TaxID=254758 RepID=UPI0011A7D068|nr:hypothetical protein [Siminovitchia fortis]
MGEKDKRRGEEGVVWVEEGLGYEVEGMGVGGGEEGEEGRVKEGGGVGWGGVGDGVGGRW